MGECKRRPEKKISPRLFAEAMVRGASFEEAMLRAGYSQSCAKRGRKQLSKACLLAWDRAIQQHVDELARVGVSVTPEKQAALVRGKLVRNVAEGKDESVASLKMLGQDRRVNLFNPENMTGIVVIEAPRAVPVLPDHIEGIAPPRADLPPYIGDNALLDRGAKAGGQG